MAVRKEIVKNVYGEPLKVVYVIDPFDEKDMRDMDRTMKMLNLSKHIDRNKPFYSRILKEKEA